jgi:hypothetical protein
MKKEAPENEASHFSHSLREAVFLCVPSMIDSLEVEVLYPA